MDCINLFSVSLCLCACQRRAEELCSLVDQCFQMVYTEATMRFFDHNVMEGAVGPASELSYTGTHLLCWRHTGLRSSSVQADGHGRSMPERSGASVPRRSLRPTVQPETSLFCLAKSIAHTTSLTQHERLLRFCHCWSILMEQSPGPCLQPELPHVAH